jgi:hypothetical protein
MTTAIPTRSLRLLVTALITLACSASSVWADSIVLRNRSGAGGTVLISEAGEPITQAGFSSPPAPTTGVFTFGDTATASARGASSTFTADIATSISPSRFTAQGNLSAVASQGDLAVAGLNGFTASQIDFVLSEAHAFTYAGRFLLERDGSDREVTPLVFAGLASIVDGASFQVFQDQLANFSGLLVPLGTHVIEHAGVIGPGTYVLSPALASIFQTASATFPSTRGRLAFDVAFSLAPVPAPTPEPTTVALLGIGIACVMRREWRRREIASAGARTPRGEIAEASCPEK